MHTQRQSYLFKNRSRSPQFSQATQRDKRHQYGATKSRRRCRPPPPPSVLFIQLFASFLNIPSLFFLPSPPPRLLCLHFFLFIFALREANILPVFSRKKKKKKKLIWSLPLFSSPSPSSFVFPLLIISSILIVLMSVFRRIMYCRGAAGS